MDLKDLIQLTHQGESDTLDFKRELPPNMTDIASVLCSFSNTKGGTLLIGVDDNGDIIGVSSPDRIHQRLVGVAHGSCNPPLTDVGFGTVDVGNGRSVVWVTIPRRSSGVCFVEQKIYARIGPTSTPIRSSNQLDAIQNSKTHDALPVPSSKLRHFPGSKIVFSRDAVLADIIAALHRPISVVSIQGISGIGKSTLAGYLATKLQEDNYTVAWVECRLETTLDIVKLELAEAVRDRGLHELHKRVLAVEGKPISQIEQLLALASDNNIVVVMNEYHNCSNLDIQNLLRLSEQYCKGPQFVLTVRVRPQALGTYNTSAVYPITLSKGLDRDASAEYLQLCGVDLTPSLIDSAWHITGNGHPKALQLFASRAQRISPKLLLSSLPVFRDSVTSQWLLPLLEELPDDARAFVKDLAIFDKAVPIDKLTNTSNGNDALPLLLILVDRFICDLTEDGRLSMHPMIREYARDLDTRITRNEWATSVWIGSINLRDEAGPLTDEQADDLVAAWTHTVQNAELQELSTTIVLRLRKTLMTLSRYSQLQLLLDKTIPRTPIAQELFALQKCKILNVWGQYDESLNLLSNFLSMPHSRKNLTREAVLEEAKALLGLEKPVEASELLKSHWGLFSRLRDSLHSVRYLNRLIEALIQAGNVADAIEYAHQSFRAAVGRDDKVQGGTVARLLASCYFKSGETQTAIQMADLSIKLFAEASMRTEGAISRMVLARAFKNLGDHTRANAEFHIAAAHFADVGDLRRKSECEEELGRFTSI